MISNLDFRKQVIAATGLFVVLLLLIWQVTITDTVALYSEVRSKEHRLELVSSKMNEVDASDGGNGPISVVLPASDTVSTRDFVTGCISRAADRFGCLVTEIPNSKQNPVGSIEVQTNHFGIKGGFNSLVRMLRTVETELYPVAHVVSVRFSTVRDLNTRRNSLILSIVTQSFKEKAIENEKTVS